MEIIKTDELKDNKMSDVLSAKVILSDETVEIIRATLAPLAEIPAHPNDIDVVLEVVEGVGELTVGEENFILETGMFAKVPKNINRAWRNLGDSNFVFQAIKYKNS